MIRAGSALDFPLRVARHAAPEVFVPSETPYRAKFAQPAEWQPHRACWLAWPSHADLWKESLETAQAEFVALCHDIHAEGRGEQLEVLVSDAEQEKLAAAALKAFSPRFHQIPFGDIWLRDTAPVFVTNPTGAVASVRFGFNGWGGKYVLDHDGEVSQRVAQAAGLPEFHFEGIFEGGSIDVDGEGTGLTTRQCLLNQNRNPDLGAFEVGMWLREALGVERLIWIDEGLLNDHTDGHIDTIARFVAPGVVVCMESAGKDDPNRRVLDEIARQLGAAKDAKGRKLQVVRIPSPGKLLDGAGRAMPASYVNFYIGNATVIVPTYGVPNDDEAVRRIAALFPSRQTTGRRAKAILEGGGAFHCITQQEPLGSAGAAK
jgi:agmatine deiminase